MARRRNRGIRIRPTRARPPILSRAEPILTQAEIDHLLNALEDPGPTPGPTPGEPRSPQMQMAASKGRTIRNFQYREKVKLGPVYLKGDPVGVKSTLVHYAISMETKKDSVKISRVYETIVSKKQLKTLDKAKAFIHGKHPKVKSTLNSPRPSGFILKRKSHE